MRLADRQCTGDKAEAVVGRGEAPRRRRDRVRADRTGGGGARGQGRSAAQDARRVAVDESAERGRQRRVGVAVELRLIVGGDRQRRRGHRQRAADHGHIVVGEPAGRRIDGRGHDSVGSHGAGVAGRCGVDGCNRIVILQADHRAGQQGIGRTIDLGLVGGDDDQRGLKDAERAVDRRHIIVAQAMVNRAVDDSGRDAIAADAAVGVGRRHVRSAQRVTVLDSEDQAREGRIGVAVVPRLIAGDDDQGGRGDRQRAIGGEEIIVGRGKAPRRRHDRVATHRAGRGGDRAQARRAAHDARRVAVLEAGAGGGEGGDGIAVELRLIVGGDRQVRLPTVSVPATKLKL